MNLQLGAQGCHRDPDHGCVSEHLLSPRGLFPAPLQPLQQQSTTKKENKLRHCCEFTAAGIAVWRLGNRGLSGGTQSS